MSYAPQLQGGRARGRMRAAVLYGREDFEPSIISVIGNKKGNFYDTARVCWLR
jgi:hypothetical protein